MASVTWTHNGVADHATRRHDAPHAMCGQPITSRADATGQRCPLCVETLRRQRVTVNTKWAPESRRLRVAGWLPTIGGGL